MASTYEYIIVDDRGRQHFLRSPSCGSLAFKFTGLLAHRDYRTPVERAVYYGRWRLRLEGSAFLTTLWILAFVALTGAAIITALIFSVLTGDAEWFVTVGATWALAALALLCRICFRTWARRHIASRRSSLPPVCLACTYDLSGLSAQADGCTLCPECAAAWRLA